MNFSSKTPESEKDCAQTPWWLVHAVGRYIGKDFKLDVCANINTAKTDEYFSLDERGQDGLELPWSDMNWCNPPFSNIHPWVSKAIWEAGFRRESVVLMPDKPETGYVREASALADTIIRMPFRLKFLRPDGTKFLNKKGAEQGPTFPVLLAYFTKIGLDLPTRYVYHDFR